MAYCRRDTLAEVARGGDAPSHVGFVQRGWPFRMTALLLTACLFSDPTVTLAQTEHYHVRAEQVDATETAAMLEQLHAELARYFGRAPAGVLEVEIWATAERFKAALARDGQQYLGGGGYYAPGNRKVYLHVQPSRYYTRQLILHEATHQFHFLVATGNQLASAEWYFEGMAEYYGMHHWDGQTLRTGVVPAISLEDYPAKALEELDRRAARMGNVVAGGEPIDRPLAWALVHFLRDRDERRFRKLASYLDNHRDARAAWRVVYGRVTPATVDALRQWIVAHQQPWQSIWIEWQQWGDAMEGFASTTGLAILKDDPGRIAAELTPVSGNLRAGLVFGYRSPESFHLLHVFEDGRIWVIARESGQWRILSQYRLRQRPDQYRVALACRDGEVQLAVNGRILTPVAADGKVGLSVDGCCVRFRVSTDESAWPLAE